MNTMYQCRICQARYAYDELMALRKVTPVYNGVLTGRQFLPCTHEFSSLEQITVTCHQCGQVGEKSEMWDDGPMDGCYVGGVTLYLCQDCHEKEVDADFWAIVTRWPRSEKEPMEEKKDLTLHSPENVFHLTLTRKQIEYIIGICQNDEMDWGDQEMADEVAESLSQQTGIH